jgi:hypothetical protein
MQQTGHVAAPGRSTEFSIHSAEKSEKEKCPPSSVKLAETLCNLMELIS